MDNLREIVDSTEGDAKKALEYLTHTLAEKIRANDTLSQRNEALQHDNKLLRKKIYGTSSEKIKSDAFSLQDNLFDEIELCIQEDCEEDPIKAPASPTEKNTTQSKKKPGRKPLPPHFPRQIVEHDLPNTEKLCACGCEMDAIGVDISEELAYQRPTFTVIAHHRKKYGCKVCNKKSKQSENHPAVIKTAAKPEKLIPKSIATASLLSVIIVSKFCDHLPLYRLEGIFKREKVHLSRQTMSVWVLKVSGTIIPLVNLLEEHIVQHDVAYADESPLQVLHEEGRAAKTKSYMWCFIGGPENQRSVVYQYHPSRSASVPNTFFEGYQGGLHCDGYVGYQELISSESITGINCMAHVRRKFIEALPNGKEKGIAGHVVRTLRALYAIEATLKNKNASVETIKSVRQEQSKPILEDLKAYLDKKIKVTPSQTPIRKAIQYALNRWIYLVTYLEDGRYEIDNNRAERSIKPFVMGRKAWLFANTALGAHASARLFTLIESAKANNIEPHAYLEYIFNELPLCKTVEDYEALLPWVLKDRLPQIKEKPT